VCGVAPRSGEIRFQLGIPYHPFANAKGIEDAHAVFAKTLYSIAKGSSQIYQLDKPETG
jgi:hypothetical protein